MTIRALYWQSTETSPRLTEEEIEKLFNTCQQLSQMGMLNGKFQHSCTPLFWVRMGKEN